MFPLFLLAARTAELPSDLLALPAAPAEIQRARPLTASDIAETTIATGFTGTLVPRQPNAFLACGIHRVFRNSCAKRLRRTRRACRRSPRRCGRRKDGWCGRRRWRSADR